MVESRRRGKRERRDQRFMGRRYATGGQDFVAELGKLLAMALPRIAPMKAVTGELPPPG
jgi:hypothetical protein